MKIPFKNDHPAKRYSDSVLATLTGTGSVTPGQSFNVNYGLASVQSLKTGFAVVDRHEVAPGKVRILAYSQGQENTVSGSGDLLQLQFKSLPSSSTVIYSRIQGWVTSSHQR
ncbi:hypothetical protein LJR153_004808 [Paenibacillus sp. LjRoot153]|uniref:hypothetical protein n=1 Tax=Paenibacillus sp. LjRoot153 TaxID=3342270 RepID=UPI003ECFA6AE